MHTKPWNRHSRWLAAGLLTWGAITMTTLSGCEDARKEKLLDIEAPGVDIEINKTGTDRDVDVDVKTDKN